jgi:hypothetical protein
MEYTLDSITHAVECLKEKLNIKEVTTIPLVANLDKLTEIRNNVYYFGVLTTGDNTINIGLNLLGMNYIDVQVNSQIIGLFDSITTELLDGETVTKGQFRGFTIITEPSAYKV